MSYYFEEELEFIWNYINREEIPLCPECEFPMVLKIPSKGQTWTPFWGCSQFPECRGIRGIKPNGEYLTDIEMGIDRENELNWLDYEIDWMD